VGALIAGRMGRPDLAAAATGDPVLLGKGGSPAENAADAVTVINATGVDTGALIAHATGNGIALTGTTDHGHGVIGSAASDGVGVYGISASNGGVLGVSTSSVGVGAASINDAAIRGDSAWDTPTTNFNVPSRKTAILGFLGSTLNAAINTDETGIYGFADLSSNSTGVWGDSSQGVGVTGTGDWGVYGEGRVGVYGHGTYGVYGSGTTGVYARAATASATALYTNGKIVFACRSGRSYVGSGHNYRDVAISGMTSSSAVIATLQTNRAGFYVQSVISYAGKFRIYLNKTAPGTTYFSYIVIG